MKKNLSYLLCMYGLILLLPFLATLLMSGTDLLKVHCSSEERWLPLMLAMEIESDAPKEAMKVQGILDRTNYRFALENRDLKEQIYSPIVKYFKNIHRRKRLFEEYDTYRRIFLENNEILTYKGKLCWVPYHSISSGRTRDGKEVLGDTVYEYLVSVESSWDRNNPDYISSFEFGQEFQKEINILSTDSAGYVTQVQTGEEIISGEEIREQLQLPSSAFSFQNTKGQTRITCKGKGHGLGLSQYGAITMADKGKTYIEILQNYFPKMEIGE